MPSEVWDEITYPILNFNGATVEVQEWISNFIPHFIRHVITYPSCFRDIWQQLTNQILKGNIHLLRSLCVAIFSEEVSQISCMATARPFWDYSMGIATLYLYFFYTLKESNYIYFHRSILLDVITAASLDLVY